MLFDCLTVTGTPCFIYSIEPPVLINAEYIYTELPIAFITNGELIFSPFTFITFPSQFIAVVDTTLCSFIEIASAPAFLSSLTTSNKSL